MQKELEIKGMSCGHCVNHATNALAEVDGVKKVTVNLENGKGHAVVEVEPKVTNEALKEAIAEVGYEVTEIIG